MVRLRGSPISSPINQHDHRDARGERETGLLIRQFLYPRRAGARASPTFIFVAPATAAAAGCMPPLSRPAPNLDPWASVLAAQPATQGSTSPSLPRRIPSERSRKAGQPSPPPSPSQLKRRLWRRWWRRWCKRRQRWWLWRQQRERQDRIDRCLATPAWWRLARRHHRTQSWEFSST